MPRKLADCVSAFDLLLSEKTDEGEILRAGAQIVGGLVAQDDWLEAAFAVPDEQHYCTYLLFLDQRRRFSISSFVWAGGQSTPIHDHTVWGLVGVLRGAELSQSFDLGQGGVPVGVGNELRLEAGEVAAVAPSIGDVHRVSNAFRDSVSISIHVYGADISTVERSVFHESGRRSRFRSSYVNPPELLPYDLQDCA